MDTLSAVMDGHRARGASLLRCEMTAPWALRIEDDAAVAIIVMLRGDAVITAADADPVTLCPGDVAIVRGSAPYLFGDSSETVPTVVIEPGNVCRSLTGEHLDVSMGLGTRTWGNGPGGETAFLTATWQLASQVTGRLLDTLPHVAVVPAHLRDLRLGELLAEEVAHDQPGQDVVLDRLVDLVLVASLREWFESPDARPPLWWKAQSDPVVRQALSLMHESPEQPWTLDSLAARLSVSRATLSRRFALVVEQPPMEYLTQWRLARAADLLRAGDLTVEQAARAVGYSNPFAFSTAFRRAHGVPPRDIRRAVAG